MMQIPSHVLLVLLLFLISARSSAQRDESSRRLTDVGKFLSNSIQKIKDILPTRRKRDEVKSSPKYLPKRMPWPLRAETAVSSSVTSQVLSAFQLVKSRIDSLLQESRSEPDAQARRILAENSPIWLGGSGYWSDATSWSTGVVPDSASAVVITIETSEIIYLEDNVTMTSLILNGNGMLRLSARVQVTVSGSVTFAGGYISGPDVITSATTPVIVTAGDTTLSGSATRYLTNVYYVQAASTMIWSQGDLVMFNSTVQIDNGAILDAGSSSDTADMTVRSSVAQAYFDVYPDSVLNKDGLVIRNINPTEGGVYDYIVSNGVVLKHATSWNGTESYVINVQQDIAAAYYYNTRVPGSEIGYPYSVYNLTSITTVDECASLCVYVGWCLSFDYMYMNQTCALSKFNMEDVGGLNAATNTSDGVPFPVSHYELNSALRTMDSYLLVEGSLRVFSASTALETDRNVAAKLAVRFEVDVVVADGGIMLVKTGGEAICSFALSVTENSALQMAEYNSSLAMTSSTAKLTVSETASISLVDANDAVFRGGAGASSAQQFLNTSTVATLELRGGGTAHTVAGSMASMALVVEGPSTALYLHPNVDANSKSVVALDSLWLYNAGKVFMTTRPATLMTSKRVSVESGGVLTVNNLIVTVSEWLVVGNTSFITAAGQGFGQGIGPGAGITNALGASGGSHGGMGGASRWVPATAAAYGTSINPATAGSGGGVGAASSYASSTSGAGGGIITINVALGTVTVDGTLTTDGVDGTSAGGGGAGGSIAINTRTLSGSGLLSSAGGDGDFSGGRVSAGGGGGGRISVVLSAQATGDFTGSFDASGGSRHTAYESTSAPSSLEQAGAGTIYVSMNAAIEAVVVSTVKLTDYLDNIETRTPLSKSEEIAAGVDSAASASAYTYAEAYLLDGDVDQFADCLLDLHVIGNSPLVLSQGEFCFKDVIGSGTDPSVRADGGVAIVLPDAFVLQTATLLLQDCTFLATTNLKITAGGVLQLQDMGGGMASAVNSGSGSAFRFGSVDIYDGGTLAAWNDTVQVTIASLTLRNATIATEEVVTLVAATFSLQNGTFQGSVDPSPTTAQAKSVSSSRVVLTSATKTNVIGDVTLNGVQLVNAGQMYADGSSIDFLSTLSTVGYSMVHFTSTGSLNVGSMVAPTDLTFYLYVTIDSAVTISDTCTVTLADGGTCDASTCSVALSGGSATLSVVSTLFTMKSATYVSGTGMLSVSDKGKLRLPASTTHSAFTLTVGDGGILEVGYANGFGNVTTPKRCVIAADIIVTSNGTISIADNSSLLTASITMRMGSELDLLSTSSALTLQTGESLFSGGLVTGTGTVTVNAPAILHLEAVETELALSNFTFLVLEKTHFINNGVVKAYNNTVNWVRGAQIDNHGLIDMYGEQSWVAEGNLYPYVSLGYCQFDILPNGVSTIYGVTAVEDCAYKCSTLTVEVSYAGGAQRPIVTEYTCLAFLYNSELNTCQLQSTEDTDDYGICIVNGPEDTADVPAQWQLYTKTATWAQSAVVLNNYGTITAHDGASAHIELTLNNFNTLSVAAGGMLTVTANLQQTATGTITTAGSFVMQEGYDQTSSSVLAGTIIGTGSFHFAAPYEDSASSSVLLGSLTFDAPALTVLVSDSVQVLYNVPEISLLNLTVSGSGASLFIAKESLRLTVTDTLVLSDGASISSQALAQDTNGALYGVVTSDAGAVDANITAGRILMSGGAELALSYAFVWADIVSIDASEITCSGRGYTFANPGTSAAFAGAYGFLGSAGGTHGGAGASGYSYSGVETYNTLAAGLASYGSFATPDTWGAPGGWSVVGSANTTVSSGAGGGFIQIKATSIDIDNGSLLTCAGNSPTNQLTGGGAGGTLVLRASVLKGDGSISANGGDGGSMTVETVGQGGGGGGGRIALLIQDSTGYSGSVSSMGGAGFQRGSAGTIFKKTLSAATGGDLTISNYVSTEADDTQMRTIIDSTTTFTNLDNFRVLNAAKVILNTPDKTFAVHNFVGDSTNGVVYVMSGTYLTAASTAGGSVPATSLLLTGLSLVVGTGTLYATDVYVKTGGLLALGQVPSTKSGDTSTSGGTRTYTFTNVYVEAGGHLTFDYQTFAAHASATNIVLLTVTNNLILSATGIIESNTQGYSGSNAFNDSYPACTGCGTFFTIGGGGGGYGGAGGGGISVGVGGVAYGNLAAPLRHGSGGGGAFPGVRGGAGGGIVYMSASTMQLNGIVSANGGEGFGSGAGGGSGGSVFLTTGSLTGSGSITANGGDGLYSSVYFGGAGGGGRVLVKCSTCVTGSALTSIDESPMLTFTGVASALNGAYQLVTYPEPDTQTPIWAELDATVLELLDDVAAGGLSVPRGAAGTVLWQSTVGGTPPTLLIVKAMSQVLASITVPYTAGAGVQKEKQYNLTDTDTIFTSADSTLNAFKYVLLQNEGQLLLASGAAVSVSNAIYMEAQAKLTVSSGAALTLPDTVAIDNGQLALNGHLTGAAYLTMSNAAVMEISSGASWVSTVASAAAPTKTYAYIYTELSLTVNTFQAHTIILTGSSGIKVKGGSALQNNRFVLTVDTLRLDDTATYLSADAQGYEAADPTADDLTSVAAHLADFQALGNVSFGDGGFHAGRGGGVYYEYASHGNALFPVTPGGAGGSTFSYTGGAGGGTIHVVAKTRILVMGTISADGGDACDLDAASNAGGGAGGSIWLEVTAGYVEGTGRISASGGSACAAITGGGGGSGGRAAIYQSGVTTHFTGKVYVVSGTVSSSLPTAVDGFPTIDPSGGSVFVSSSGGTNSFVTATNGEKGGSSVQLFDACTTALMTTKYLLVSDLTVVLGKACPFRVSTAVALLSTLSATYAGVSWVYVGGAGTLPGINARECVVQNGAALVVVAAMAVTCDMTVDHASLLFSGALTLSASATLSISTKNATLVGTAFDISTLTTPTLVSNYWASVYTAPTLYDDSEAMSLISLTGALTVGSSCSVEFMIETGAFTLSNFIEADSITVSSGGSITATAVAQNVAWDESHHASYTFFGSPSGVGYAATGGGHAGAGTAGWGNTVVGKARGENQLLRPYGPGGAGGADSNLQALGGGGGGGLYFSITSSFTLNGNIDVSGGDATSGSIAGGGAAGSVYIASVTGSISGSGSITASGGLGSLGVIANIGTSMVFGGAGAGGRISINMCLDDSSITFTALGGLAVQLPASIQGPITVNMLAGGVSPLTLQELYSAAAGVVARTIGSGSCASNRLTSQLSSLTINTVAVTSWDITVVRSGSTGDTFTNAFLVNAAKALGLSGVVSNIASVQATPATILFPLYGVTGSVIISALTIYASELSLNGVGTVRIDAFSSPNAVPSTLTTAGSVILTPTPTTMTLSNIVLNVTESSTIAIATNSALSLSVGAEIHLVNTNEYADLHAADWTVESSYKTLSFSGAVTLAGGSGIYGAKVGLAAASLTLTGASTVSASARGFYGGVPSGVVASFSGGPGGGQAGFSGGDGGGYGGEGGRGLDTLLLYGQDDSYISALNRSYALNDSTLGADYLNNNGSSYGDLTSPRAFGSGGGAVINTVASGGRGGGVVYLAITGAISLSKDSSIASNGEDTYLGGGGGAGGAIWINGGTGVTGYGVIEAVGGAICNTVGCSTNVVTSGGVGGGGRVYVNAALTSHLGWVNVRSGTANQTTSVLVSPQQGTIYRSDSVVASLTTTSYSVNKKAIDIAFKDNAVVMVQTITSNATNGYWLLGYRTKRALFHELAWNAEAADVQAALQSLDLSDTKHISVLRSITDGVYVWTVFFYDPLSVVSLIDVESYLYTTTYYPDLTVALLDPNDNSVYAYRSFSFSVGGVASYSAAELSTMIKFSNTQITTALSFGYWLNQHTFRVVVVDLATVPSFTLQYLFPVTTLLGRLSSSNQPTYTA